MDYDFFESLSTEEAKSFLMQFLEAEKKMMGEVMPCASSEGVPADYTIKTLPQFLICIFNRLKTVPIKPDDSLPEWIKHSASYTSNLFDFDDESKILILRGAYYLGETFVKSYQQLSWSIGDQDTAVKNMPVIRGFSKNLEMAPMLVLENIFGRIMSGNGSTSDIKDMVLSWTKKVGKK